MSELKTADVQTLAAIYKILGLEFNLNGLMDVEIDIRYGEVIKVKETRYSLIKKPTSA